MKERRKLLQKGSKKCMKVLEWNWLDQFCLVRLSHDVLPLALSVSTAPTMYEYKMTV